MKKITLILWIIITIGCIALFVMHRITSNDTYAILLLGSVAIDGYFLGILVGWNCGSVEERAKNKPRLYLPLDKQEEHDEIAQIVEAQRLYAQSKDKKVCKKCANCKYYASKMLNPTGKVYKCNYCDYYEGNIVRNVNLFTSCKHFEEKE